MNARQTGKGTDKQQRSTNCTPAEARTTPSKMASDTLCKTIKRPTGSTEARLRLQGNHSLPVGIVAGLKEDQWPGDSDFDDDQYFPEGTPTGCKDGCRKWPCGNTTKQWSPELKDAERKVELKAFCGTFTL